MSARGGIRAAVAALTGAVAALTLSGCYVDVGALEHRTLSYSVSAPVHALVLNARLGNIDVTGGEQSHVSVTERLSFRGPVPQITHRVSGGTLTLAGNCPGSQTCRLDYDIHVPSAIPVKISADAGAIQLNGLAGQVTAHTNAGDISLSALSGAIEVTDHAGSIRGQVSSAHAALSSTVGGIDVSFFTAPAALTARTTVGSVTLHVPGDVSYAIDAHSSVGSTRISVRAASASPHSITARTGTGSVTIEPR
jgi:hypothetical protein